MLEFITEEKATEIGLTDDQKNAIATAHNEWLPTVKKEWDGAASKGADTILDNVAKGIAEKYGYTVPRAQGEKYDEYLAKVDDFRFGSLKSDYEKKKSEYDEKLKTFDGGKGQQEKLEKLANDLDDAKKKLANFDELSEKASKADEYSNKYATLKQSFAYTQVRPTFPDTVNKYEADAKYNEFVQKTNEKYNIEIDENNVAWAIDKENEHSKKKLSELVDNDKELSELAAGRVQKGVNARTQTGNIAGLEVEIPHGADSETASKAINTYLDSKNIGFDHAERTAKFQELWAKYKEASKAA